MERQNRSIKEWYLDPQLARVADMMPVTDLTDYLLAREETEKFKHFVGQLPDDERVYIYEEIIGNLEQEENLRLRIYRPKNNKGELPCLIYFHGGGFVLGDLEMEHPRCQKICGDVDCVVVAVDFRLAPEYAFPCGLHDCYAALVWVRENVSKLGVRSDRIAVGGCSTGATLAASVALMAREKGGPNICFQFLLYPALDDRLNTPSMLEYKNIPGGDRSGAELMWRYYLSDVDGEPSYLAAPSRVEDLSGLPPAYLMTNEIDVCRDEEIDYALRLLSVGVPTELHNYTGTFHAFEIMVRSADISIHAIEQQMYVLRRALHSRSFASLDSQRKVI